MELKWLATLRFRFKSKGQAGYQKVMQVKLRIASKVRVVTIDIIISFGW